MALPTLVHVRRRERETAPPPGPVDATRAALQDELSGVSAGERVAIAVGSRGIAGIADVVRTCVTLVRERGAEPFVVPAMGSHGGATAEGQREVLASLGITEEGVGAPVVASMETVKLGTVEVGEGDLLDVYVDTHAARADHVLLANRLKSHTSFSGAVESGLAKQLAIGLGKQRGAQELHRLGPAHLERRIVAAARLLTTELSVLGGLALIEDGRKRLAQVAFLPPADIGGEGEAALLVLAKAQEGRLPFRHLDVLLVDLMGKEISGTGMDTNVLGRRMVRGMPEPPGVAITNVVVLGVSQASEGNAVGIGLADFTTAAAIADVDLAVTYANALTAGQQGVQRAQLPIVLATDQDAIQAALHTAGLSDPADVRMVRMRNTLRLDELWVTPNLLPECAEEYLPVGNPAGAPLAFGPAGHIDNGVRS